MIDPADLPRLGTLRITASMQPPHPPGAMDFPLEPTIHKIGRTRWADAYRWRSLHDAGAKLAFASDWPVADIAVLRGIKAAVTRKPWAENLLDESVDLSTAIAAYTVGGARAEHTEDRKGMLKPGYLADIVVLTGDIEAVSPQDIDRLDVALTICGGKIVHRAAYGTITAPSGSAGR